MSTLRESRGRFDWIDVISLEEVRIHLGVKKGAQFRNGFLVSAIYFF